MMVLLALTTASALSLSEFRITFMHVSELGRLGADIAIEGPSATPATGD
jgi:UDP-N-acetylglucosamine enolpyruvyl transferase